MSEEKKQRLKEYQKSYRETKKKYFIDVKNQLIVLSRKDSYSNKGASQNCYHKDIFISASYNDER